MLSIRYLLPTLLLLSVISVAPKLLFADEGKVFLKVGAILPLTGGAADYGVSIKNGISLAQEHHPEAFKRIRFLYEDTQYTARQALTAFKKLTAADQVNLIYEFGVPPFKALAPLAESQEIALVGQCVDASMAGGEKYVFKFMNPPDEYMKVQTRFLKQKGWNKIGVILTEHSYLEEMFEAFKRNLLPGQSVTIIQRLPLDEMDLRSYVLKTKSQDVDVVGVFLYIGQISQFYKQARSLRFAKPTFGTNFFESLSEVKAADGAMAGAMYAHNEVNSEFLSQYKARFGTGTQITFAALSYEFARTIADLFGTRTETPSSAEIVRSFENLEKRAGFAAGPYEFVSSNRFGKYFRFPVVMKQIGRNDGFEVIE